MNRERIRLERECRTFTRLLSGRVANAYLLTKYLEAHARSGALQEREGFDTRLLRAASGSPGLARLADGYARFFYPAGTLRKKLVLTLALVEVTPPYSGAVEGAPARTRMATVALLGLTALVGVISLGLGLLLFGPLHLVSRHGGRER